MILISNDRQTDEFEHTWPLSLNRIAQCSHPIFYQPYRGDMLGEECGSVRSSNVEESSKAKMNRARASQFTSESVISNINFNNKSETQKYQIARNF